MWKSMNVSGFPGEKDGKSSNMSFWVNRLSVGRNFFEFFETAYLMSTVSTEFGCSKGRAYAAETAGF